MRNKIDDLRNHLFATIEGLLDQDNPIEIDKAKAIADVAQVIINSAKVEIDFLNKVGGNGTNFIPQSPMIENKK
jgi:hypothetical protein